ncbi:MAG: DNA-processing protein DprA [Neisseria sp.]|uniref:DNA-processing protein DprA n=1 Tax=Neisseria sp. TaxID=192066 RepID=UPI0026DC4C0F|nr:DNA-processing protein DprA [Neisseria sp.]MDO4641401.1 DNA-processing protein DprA [Neisseria sp.]
MNHQEYYAWVQLALTPYIGAESFVKLIRFFGTASQVLAAPVEQIKQLVHHKQAVAEWDKNREQAKMAADAALTWAQGEGCRLMLLNEADFPMMLAEGLTPPPLLFLRGRSELLMRPSVAIVGSRHATPQAMRIARDFAKALSEQGIGVVSGMASGIDTAAHQGALDGSAGTVAVWGTGIDRIYPQANKQLAYQIAETGLIVSEFPLGTRPLAGNFPRRNRLIAALSQATLVVEAAVESGSLITARLAGEMGREVMAVPGSIDNPHSKGCHKLIKEGAKLVENLEDILQECPQLLHKTGMSSYSIYSDSVSQTSVAGENASKQTSFQADKAAEHIGVNTEADSVLEAMGYDPVHPDSLAGRLDLATADVYALLLEMELLGVVAAMPGGRYQRVRK